MTTKWVERRCWNCRMCSTGRILKQSKENKNVFVNAFHFTCLRDGSEKRKDDCCDHHKTFFEESGDQ